MKQVIAGVRWSTVRLWYHPWMKKRRPRESGHKSCQMSSYNELGAGSMLSKYPCGLLDDWIISTVISLNIIPTIQRHLCNYVWVPLSLQCLQVWLQDSHFFWNWRKHMQESQNIEKLKLFRSCSTNLRVTVLWIECFLVGSKMFWVIIIFNCQVKWASIAMLNKRV